MSYNCEQCGTKTDIVYGSGRFCSSQCAKAFSTLSSTKPTHVEKACCDCGTAVLVKKQKSASITRCAVCEPLSKMRVCELCTSKFHPTTKSAKKCSHQWCKKHATLPKLINHFGFDESTIGTDAYTAEFQRVVDLIQQEYHQDGHSLKSLCELHNYNDPGNMGKFLTSLGITLRSRRDSQYNHIDSDRYEPSPKLVNPKYKNGWHTTHMGTEVFYRSSYELEYAEELDEQRIPYSMEDIQIKYWDTKENRYRRAIPDFHLHDSNTLVEIKSEWTLDIQNMIDKHKAYTDLGYNFKLILDKQEVTIDELKSRI